MTTDVTVLKRLKERDVKAVCLKLVCISFLLRRSWSVICLVPIQHQLIAGLYHSLGVGLAEGGWGWQRGGGVGRGGEGAGGGSRGFT